MISITPIGIERTEKKTEKTDRFKKNFLCANYSDFILLLDILLLLNERIQGLLLIPIRNRDGKKELLEQTSSSGHLKLGFLGSSRLYSLFG